MCCGSNRAAARAAVTAAAPSAARSAAPSVGAPAAPSSSVTMFEYVGGSQETWIRGSVSGQLYRFRRRGDRVRVDARDGPGLAGLPSLRLVR